MCTEYKPDIVGITETWFKEDLNDNELAIPNMCLLRQDRLDVVVALRYITVTVYHVIVFLI